MKFTNGYWLTRDEIEPIYAVEYGYHRVDGDVLQVYAPSMHISRRGDCVNIPMLTITFSSPMEDVIKVSVEHFRGKVRKGPFFEKSNRWKIFRQCDRIKPEISWNEFTARGD